MGTSFLKNIGTSIPGPLGPWGGAGRGWGRCQRSPGKGSPKAVSKETEVGGGGLSGQRLRPSVPGKVRF